MFRGNVSPWVTQEWQYRIRFQMGSLSDVNLLTVPPSPSLQIQGQNILLFLSLNNI